MNDALQMWTVYDNPSDYPGKFVARLLLIARGKLDPVHTDKVLIANSLEQLREQLPRGLYRLVRHPNDEPHIVEVWL